MLSQVAIEQRFEHGMSPAEIVSIHHYTEGVPTNAALRRALRTGQRPDSFDEAFSLSLRDALDRLPDRTGTTYRGADLPPDALARYRPGSVVTENMFLSTSKSREVAWGNFEGNVQFVVRGRTGKDIERLSGFRENEQEVLFDAYSRFRVVGREDRDEYVRIELKEVDRHGD